MKGADVASMTMDVIQSIPNLDWLSVWVKAYAFIHAGDNQRAINTIWSARHRRHHQRLAALSDQLLLLRLLAAPWRRSRCCGTTWTCW